LSWITNKGNDFHTNSDLRALPGAYDIVFAILDAKREVSRFIGTAAVENHLNKPQARNLESAFISADRMISVSMLKLGAPFIGENSQARVSNGFSVFLYIYHRR
jgi:hypothetical protein